MTTTVAGSFVIAADDPMLTGHFPGQPIVPGVVLLDRAMALVAATAVGVVSGPLNAKFLRPVLANQHVRVQCRIDAHSVQIDATVDGMAVMRVTAAQGGI